MFEYEENTQLDRSFEGSLERILKSSRKETRVQLPAKIVKINNQDNVNIEYYSNGVASTLANVPVKHHKTQNAFFIIKLKEGDKGIVTFFDDDIDLYRTSGVIAESNETKVHDINDNLFEVGFYPDNENYIYPEGDLVVGTKAGALISLTDTGININGGNISITGSNVTINGNTTIDNKNFLQHTHQDSQGGTTTGVL